MGDSYEQTRYVLVVRVPRDIEVRIEDTFLGLAGATKPVMGYHITVLGPFLLPDSSGYHFLPGVEAVCARWQPFLVCLQGLSAFEAQDDSAVYLKVMDCNDLVRLHFDLLEATRDAATMQNERALKWNEETYEPHVTLALKLSDKDVKAFLRSAATHDLQATFTVEDVWLCMQEPSGPWRCVAQFPLAGAAPGHTPGADVRQDPET